MRISGPPLHKTHKNGNVDIFAKCNEGIQHYIIIKRVAAVQKTFCLLQYVVSIVE